MCARRVRPALGPLSGRAGSPDGGCGGRGRGGHAPGTARRRERASLCPGGTGWPRTGVLAPRPRAPDPGAPAGHGGGDRGDVALAKRTDCTATARASSMGPCAQGARPGTQKPGARSRRADGSVPWEGGQLELGPVCAAEASRRRGKPHRPRAGWRGGLGRRNAFLEGVRTSAGAWLFMAREQPGKGCLAGSPVVPPLPGSLIPRPPGPWLPGPPGTPSAGPAANWQMQSSVTLSPGPQTRCVAAPRPSDIPWEWVLTQGSTLRAVSGSVQRRDSPWRWGHRWGPPHAGPWLRPPPGSALTPPVAATRTPRCGARPSSTRPWCLRVIQGLWNRKEDPAPARPTAPAGLCAQAPNGPRCCRPTILGDLRARAPHAGPRPALGTAVRPPRPRRAGPLGFTRRTGCVSLGDRVSKNPIGPEHMLPPPARPPICGHSQARAACGPETLFLLKGTRGSCALTALTAGFSCLFSGGGNGGGSLSLPPLPQAIRTALPEAPSFPSREPESHRASPQSPLPRPPVAGPHRPAPVLGSHHSHAHPAAPGCGLQGHFHPNGQQCCLSGLEDPRGPQRKKTLFGHRGRRHLEEQETGGVTGRLWGSLSQPRAGSLPAAGGSGPADARGQASGAVFPVEAPPCSPVWRTPAHMQGNSRSHGVSCNMPNLLQI